MPVDTETRVQQLIKRLDAAGREEHEWRELCKKITKLYAQKDDDVYGGGEDWNILAANSNILMQAVYNNRPTPDIRRRYGDQDNPIEREAVYVLERAIGVELEDGGWHQAITQAVKELTLYGRGVVRMRYKPEFAPMDEVEKSSGDDMKDGDPLPKEAAQPEQELAWQRCPIECVPYEDFRRGPGKRWEDVKWVAFRHLLSREECVRMFGRDVGELLPMSHVVKGAIDDKGAGDPPEHMRRAIVWEMWDKPTRTVIFLNTQYRDKPLKEPTADPLKLAGFFPIPSPVYGDSDGLMPLTDYRLYKTQAEELDRVSKRISRLARVIKWSGGYDQNMQGLSSVVDADDGALVPVQMNGPGMKFAESVWLWPIEQAERVLQRLIEYRAEIKAQIYEIVGLWDIIRGNSDPNETLGAQKLKSQWGSLRIQGRQQEIQRLCRDLIRMQCECIAEHYDPMVLTLMTGIEVTPEVKQLVSSDQMRSWRIDIETDSTVSADMTGARENAGQFITGVAEFTAAFGPAVQSGLCPPDVAVELLGSFATIFKLGRGADMALARWQEQVRGQAQQGGAQPNPQQQLEQQKMQLEQQKLQIEGARIQMDGQKAQQEAELADRDMQVREAEQEAEQMKMIIPALEAQLQALAQITQALQQVAQTMVVTAQSMNAPRQAVIIRDEQGRAVGAQSIVAQPPQQLQ